MINFFFIQVLFLGITIISKTIIFIKWILLLLINFVWKIVKGLNFYPWQANKLAHPGVINVGRKKDDC